MRTLAGQNAAVAALLERSTRLRVSIDRTGSGDWVDLSNHLDLDWIDGVEYEDNSETPVGTMTARIRREWHDLSFSPLMAQSRLNSGGVLVWPKREIKIEVAVMPRRAPAASGNWFEVFRGRIDKIDWQASPIDIRCRDLGGDLQDGWVETQAVYGTDPGRAIESVIQDLLDDAFDNDWIPFAVTLYSLTGSSGTPFEAADSPGFLITKYKQGRESVMDAIQKLARVIGFECRYRWNSNDSAFRLTLYEPVRPVRSRGTITLTGDPTVNDTFQIDSVTYTAKSFSSSPDEFNIAVGDTTTTATRIATMLNEGTGRADINAWSDGATVLVEWQTGGVVGDSVTFTESMDNTTMDGSGTLGGTRGGVDAVTVHTFPPAQVLGVESLSIDVADIRNKFSGTFENSSKERITVTRRNQDSIDKYHPRQFILTEASSGPIDTVDEMVDLLDAADNDLSEPDIGQGILVPYFPWGEAADLYRFSANGIHYDSDQDLSAATLRHMISKTKSRTMITARGKPSLGSTRWLEAEGRPGVAPPADIYTDAAPDNVAATAGLGTMIVVHDDPRTMSPAIEDWFTTKCYVSTSNGFTPGPTNFVAAGRQTRFDIDGLTPGTTYYSKLQIIDFAGNVAATSTQVTVATQRVGPYHENPDGQQDQLLRNNDFNIYTLDRTTNPPDAWTVEAGTYESGGGADTIYFSVVDSATGDLSLDFNYSSTANSPKVQSLAVPFQDGDLRRFAIVAKKASGLNTNPEVRLRINWLDEDRVSVGTSTVTYELTSSFQRFMSGVGAAPSGTRYAQLELSPQSTIDSSTAWVLRVDKASILRGKGEAVGTESDSEAPDNTFRKTSWDTFSGTGVNHSSGDLTVDVPGQWEIYVVARFDDTTIPMPVEPFSGIMEIRVNGSAVDSVTFESITTTSGLQAAVNNIVRSIEDLDTVDVVTIYWKAVKATTSDLVYINASLKMTQITRED